MVVFIPASPPHGKGWQTPQQSSAGAATTIAQPSAPKAKGTNTKGTLTLVAAALSAAKAVEYVAKMTSEGSQTAFTRSVSSGGGDGQEPVPSKLGRMQGQATLAQVMAKQTHGPASSAESRALAPGHPKRPHLQVGIPLHIHSSELDGTT